MKSDSNRASNLEHRYGRLAQSGERFLHTEEVIGSIPVSPTSNTKAFSLLTFTKFRVYSNVYSNGN